MKRANCIILFLTTLIWSGCTIKPQKEQSKFSDTNRDKLSESMSSDTISDPCTGGLPDQSIVDSVEYPLRKFHFANRMGINEFITRKGDEITVEQSNCYYSTYRFIIHTSRFCNKLSDTSYLVSAATDIIREIQPAVRTSMKIDSGLVYLKRYYSEKGKGFNKEIDFDDRPEYSWRNVVILDSITHDRNSHIFSVTFYSGPL